MSICPNCFRYNFGVNCYDGAEICAFCGYDLKAKPEASLRLPPGTELKKRYIIRTESTNDGTYQIYRACDIKKDSEVTVWELLPKKLEKRMENGSISFSDEEMKKKFQQSCDELIYKCSIIKNIDILANDIFFLLSNFLIRYSLLIIKINTYKNVPNMGHFHILNFFNN